MRYELHWFLDFASLFLSSSIRFLLSNTPFLGQTEFTSLAEAGKALKAAAIEAYGPLDTIPITIDTEDSASIKLLAHHAVNQFLLNQSRDDDDRARFLKIYDFPADLDYRNPVCDHCFLVSSIFIHFVETILSYIMVPSPLPFCFNPLTLLVLFRSYSPTLSLSLPPSLFIRMCYLFNK